ncbi:head-tail joining protein [Gemmobacter caeni]|uniref:Uncharacterized protein n=1 Tax=Gemmobacter caeni TaxID=589035 RepID=A0A2T6A4I1_9RHOB|nr:hypothetical protein [Gemmobacter caeni]PTX38717.1 hypothetical protein C8N34_14111 [Gemmobacter caeni]
MTGLFDGVTGLLSGVFGGSVTFLPQVGEGRVVQSVFRETPVEVTGDDGGTVILNMPTWRVRKSDAVAVRGDQIEVSDGRRFIVGPGYISGSPAFDAFVTYRLEPVT